MGGGIEVTVAQHTNGYQTLANNGVYHKKHMISKIEKANGDVIYEHKDELFRYTLKQLQLSCKACCEMLFHHVPQQHLQTTLQLLTQV